MASADDVQKLASLARIRVEEAELSVFAKEFDGILAYVGQLDALSIDTMQKQKPVLKNVMREDGEPHEKGKYTKKIVELFPQKKDNYLSVKQIISHD